MTKLGIRILDRTFNHSGASFNVVSHGSNHGVKGKEGAKPKFLKAKPCTYCGRSHELVKHECPAYGETSNKCGKQNRFAKLSSEKKVKPKYPQRVDQVRTHYDTSSEEECVMTVKHFNTVLPLKLTAVMSTLTRMLNLSWTMGRLRTFYHCMFMRNCALTKVW